MSYTRRQDFEEGESIMACAICGVPYLFPSELTYCDDKKLRCKRTCMEETILARDRKIAASHAKREAPAPKFGTKPGWYP